MRVTLRRAGLVVGFALLATGCGELAQLPPTFATTVNAAGPDTAVELTATLAQLDRALAERHAVVHPGLSAEQIDQLAADLPCPLPALLRAMYRWHDGVERLLPAYDFLPLAEMTQEYASIRDVEFQVSGGRPGSGWRATYLPVLRLDGRESLVVDCAPGAHGAVLRYLDETDERPVKYRGIGHFLAVTAAAYAHGAYRPRDGYVDENPIRVADAFRRYALPEELAAMDANWQAIEPRLRTAGARELQLLTAYEDDYADARAIPILRARVLESDVEVVATVAYMLGTLRAQDALPDLTALLSHASPDVRNAAATAISELDRVDSEATVNRLVALIDDRTDLVRIAAIEALQTARSRRAVQPLLARLESDRPGVQLRIVDALRAIGDPAALPALRALQAKVAAMDLTAPERGGSRGADPSPRWLKDRIDQAIAALDRDAQTALPAGVDNAAQ